MSEVKDPMIKLFGRTIFLPPNEPVLHHHHHHHEQSSCSTSQDNKSNSGGEHTNCRQEHDSINLSDEESTEPFTGSGVCDTPKTPGTDAETSSPKVIPKEEPDETNPSEEKTLKKPDKILPCPRCNSMDTKFCYYNNYNVSQPRHFCKKCQRYWTAGGTMRNVPVGSGRRKNKSSCASNYRHIMVADALQAAQSGAANGIHFSSLKEDGTVLAFGAERPLFEPRGSAFNLAEKAQNCAPNGFHIAEKRIPVSYGEVEIRRDHSNGFCSMRLNLTENAGNAAGPQDSIPEKLQVFSTQVPCFSGTPWPSHWNSAHCSSPSTPHSLNSPPVTFYPASPYWGYTVSSPWNATWLSPPPPSPNQSALSTSSTSPTLGKHYRDGSMLKSSNLAKEKPVEEKDVERSVLLPKTMRIGSPNETRKSSICLTLGIKSDNKDSVSGATLFNAFQPVVDEKNHVTNTSLILQANPAALSRSVNFHESI